MGKYVAGLRKELTFFKTPVRYGSDTFQSGDTALRRFNCGINPVILQSSLISLILGCGTQPTQIEDTKQVVLPKLGSDAPARPSGPTLKLTLKGHKAPVLGAAFSPDGKRLATVSWDDTLKLWDADTGEELTSWAVPSSVEAICYHPSGSKLAVSSGSQIVEYEAATGKPLFKTPFGRMRGNLAYSPDGTLLASGSISKSVDLIDATTGQTSRVLPVRPIASVVEGVAFHPTAKRIATGDRDGAIKIWATDTGEIISTLQSPDQVFRLAFSPDGLRLAAQTSGPDGIQIWDPISGKQLYNLAGVFCRENLTYQPGGGLLAACGGEHVVLWDLRTRQIVFDYEHPPVANYYAANEAHSVAFSPDGKWLVATFGAIQDKSGASNVAYVWSVPLNLSPVTVAEVANEPPTPSQLLYQAERHIRMKEFDQALKIYNKLIKDGDKSPDLFDYYRCRGVLLIDLDRFDEAISDLKNSLSLKDKRAYLLGDTRRSQIGAAYLQKGDREAALTAFTDAIKHSGKTDGGYPLLQRASLYAEAKDYDAAIADYTALIEGNFSGVPTASVYVYRADAYYLSRSYEKASADYSKALELGLEGTVKEHAERWLVNARKAISSTSSVSDAQPK